MVTFKEEAAYVSSKCAELSCAHVVREKSKKLAALSAEETSAFMKTLHACFDQCRAKH